MYRVKNVLPGGIDEYINFKSKKDAEQYVEEKLLPYYDEFLVSVELWNVDKNKLIKKYV